MKKEKPVTIQNPLDELAETLGFQKKSWFVKLFEERFGVKPGEMR